MLRTKYMAANRLSQRPCTELDNINKANKVDINNFINTELNAFSIALVTIREAKANLLTTRYSEDS
jgi:sucrose-6-phosphate hydrolase SacC (GH32 family)